MEKKKKPAIRFKGFTDSWEQRKLGDVASSFEYGLNAAAKAYDGEYKYIRITDIDDNTHEFLTDNLTSPDIDLIGADNYKLTEGDILFARTGASVGKSYIYRNSDGLVYYAGFLIRARINEEYDEEFVFQNTLTDRYNKYIAVTSQRSGQPGVNAQEYAEFEINVPKKEEQTKIGTYFRNLDYLITLHQRKYDKLQIIKKSMLEKMFPQNGSCFPEIRFKGFTDSWEQRKLGDIADVYDGIHQTPDYTDNGIMFLSVENINTLKSEKYISEEAFIRDYKVYPEKGDILMTRIGDVGTPNVVETTEKVAFYVSLALLKPINVDSYFLCNSILSPFFQNGLKERTLVTAIPQKINKDEVGKVGLYLPTLIDEQREIGAFFQRLNNLITLHQREFKYVYCRFIINKYKYISENYICIYTKIYGGLKMNNKLELYHGSGQIVEFPEIRKTRYTKDFSWGFYCTKSYEQAYRWAERKHENGIVNVYSYIENSELNIKKFDGMCEEWLDFIAECRAGKTHPYDIVEGPMADDTIWNFVNDYLNKNISKEVFWEYARFKHPSHQISFHSIRALECLKYERSIAVENDTVE